MAYFGLVNASHVTPGATLAPQDYSSYGAGVDQGLGATRYNTGNRTGAQQAQLASQLYAQSQGRGPNPAQLQFRSNLDTANREGAAQLASIRGVNPALQARMISQATTANRLGGANQAAQLQAQQQLAATGQLAGVLGTERQQDLGQQGVNAQTVGTFGTLQNQQNQLQLQNQLSMEGLNQQANEYNATADNSLAQQEQQFWQGLAGSAFNAAGGAASMGLFGGGGGGGGYAPGAATSDLYGGSGGTSGRLGFPQFTAHGGRIRDYRRGGRIPGQAKVAGDSLRNDTVPIMASPGEIMIPRSITQAPNAPEEAAKFVAAHTGHASAVKASRDFVKALRKAHGGEVESPAEERAETTKAKAMAKELASLAARVKQLERVRKAA